MSEKPECTCDLIDVTTQGEIRYVRGLTRGCAIHPPSESEKRQMRYEAERDALRAAAMKAAREAP